MLIWNVSVGQPVQITVNANSGKQQISPFIFGKNNVLNKGTESAGMKADGNSAIDYESWLTWIDWMEATPPPTGGGDVRQLTDRGVVTIFKLTDNHKK